jgi:hypothetical protein
MKPVFCKNEYMHTTIWSDVETIVQSVHVEFGSKAELFQPILVRMDAVDRHEDGPEFDATKFAGVYVFIHEEYGCLKVGKSNSNASKRALEHLRDDTHSKDDAIHMAQLRQSDKTYMLVFALQEPECVHWVLALEYYLEMTLRKTRSLRIPTIRNG